MLAARFAQRAYEPALAESLVAASRFAGLAAPRKSGTRIAVYGAEAGDLALLLTPSRASIVTVPQTIPWKPVWMPRFP